MPKYGRITNIGANVEYLSATGTVQISNVGANIEYLTSSGTVQFDILGLMVEYSGTLDCRTRFTNFGLMIEYEIVSTGRRYGPAVG